MSSRKEHMWQWVQAGKSCVLPTLNVLEIIVYTKHEEMRHRYKATIKQSSKMYEKLQR
jgi:hypothetical protein